MEPLIPFCGNLVAKQCRRFIRVSSARQLARNQKVRNGEEKKEEIGDFTSIQQNKQEHHQKKKRMTLTTHSLSFFHIPHNDVAVVMATQRYEIFTVTAEGYRLNTNLVGIIFRHELTGVEVPKDDGCLEHVTH